MRSPVSEAVGFQADVMQQLGAGRQQQPGALGQLSLELLTTPLSLPHKEAHGDVRELAAVQQLLGPPLVTPCSAEQHSVKLTKDLQELDFT